MFVEMKALIFKMPMHNDLKRMTEKQTERGGATNPLHWKDPLPVVHAFTTSLCSILKRAQSPCPEKHHHNCNRRIRELLFKNVDSILLDHK